jgi:hypothetical protein
MQLKFLACCQKKSRCVLFFSKVWKLGTDNNSNKLILRANPVSLLRRIGIALFSSLAFLGVPMLISNLIFEDSLEMRIKSANFESRVNSAVQSFMEGVESMLAHEPEYQYPAYQFDREISSSEWLALA